MIPDTIHFIYSVTERTRPWSLVNHAAVLLARKIHDPQRLVIWTNEAGDALRDTAERARAEIVQIELPTSINDVPIHHPQYVADIIRLQVLFDHGGIYMDTDMLLRMDLRAHMAVANDHQRLLMSWETEARLSICNALMIAPPRNDFVAAWLRRIPGALLSTTWAEGGVLLPAALAKDEHLTRSRVVLHHTFACPLGLSRPWLFDPALRNEAAEMSLGSHAIHVFETYWRDIVKGVDADWIERTPCLFSDILREAVGDQK